MGAKKRVVAKRKEKLVGEKGKYRFLTIGSDPEFLLYESKGGLLIPAATLVSSTREVWLASPVGADGHPATAEIRPRPAHNVKYHLVKIADLVGGLSDFLRNYNERTDQRVQAVAQPVFNDEPLGGHIHVGMIVQDEPEAVGALTQYGFLGYGRHLLETPHPPRHPREHVAGVDLYERAVVDETREYFTLDQVVCRMHYLIGPFEDFIHPRRGGRDRIDLARLANRIEDYAYLESPEDLYLRFEYRYPSTWLANPTLAYCFLALAKLALLNLDSPALPWVTPKKSTDPGLVFSARFLKLWESPGVRISKDLHDLPTKIAEVTKTQTNSDTTTFIDFKAWQEYYHRGGIGV